MSIVQVGRNLAETTPIDWVVFLGIAALLVLAILAAGSGADRPRPRNLRRGRRDSLGGDGGAGHGVQCDGDDGGDGGGD